MQYLRWSDNSWRAMTHMRAPLPMKRMMVVSGDFYDRQFAMPAHSGDCYDRQFATPLNVERF